MIKKIDLENHFYDISSVEALQSRAKGDYPYWDKETNTIHWLEGIAMCQDKFYENLLDEIEDAFESVNDYQENKRLSGLYLLGFHSQSCALRTYKTEKTEEE